MGYWDDAVAKYRAWVREIDRILAARRRFLRERGREPTPAELARFMDDL